MKIQSLLKKENWQKFFKHLIYFIKEIPEYLKFFVLLFIFFYKKFAQWLRRLPMIGNLLSRFFEKGGRVVGTPIEKLAEKINLCHPDVRTRRTFY